MLVTRGSASRLSSGVSLPRESSLGAPKKSRIGMALAVVEGREGKGNVGFERLITMSPQEPESWISSTHSTHTHTQTRTGQYSKNRTSTQRVGECRVVHKQCVRPAEAHAQHILHQNAADLCAERAKVPTTQLTIRIQPIDDRVGVSARRGGEDVHLIQLKHLPEEEAGGG
jgi:hypothetical protein